MKRICLSAWKKGGVELTEVERKKQMKAEECNEQRKRTIRDKIQMVKGPGSV